MSRLSKSSLGAQDLLVLTLHWLLLWCIHQPFIDWSPIDEYLDQQSRKMLHSDSAKKHNTNKKKLIKIVKICNRNNGTSLFFLYHVVLLNVSSCNENHKYTSAITSITMYGKIFMFFSVLALQHEKNPTFILNYYRI